MRRVLLPVAQTPPCHAAGTSCACRPRDTHNTLSQLLRNSETPGRRVQTSTCRTAGAQSALSTVGCYVDGATPRPLPGAIAGVIRGD